VGEEAAKAASTPLLTAVTTWSRMGWIKPAASSALRPCRMSDNNSAMPCSFDLQGVPVQESDTLHHARGVTAPA
jgi:hypothetical protein